MEFLFSKWRCFSEQPLFTFVQRNNCMLLCVCVEGGGGWQYQENTTMMDRYSLSLTMMWDDVFTNDKQSTSRSSWTFCYCWDSVIVVVDVGDMKRIRMVNAV